MKKILTVLAMVALSVAMRGAGDFTATLTQEEMAATGLSRLTPDELAKLKNVVERYKVGEVASTRTAEAKAAVAPMETQKQPGWLGALVASKQSDAKGDEPVESRLVGKLITFMGRRTFTLENGQVWQMAEDGIYAGPAYESPRVTVQPGALGGFWLRIEEARLRVKVKPVKLQ